MKQASSHIQGSAAALLYLSIYAAAQETFDCHINHNGLDYDLTTVRGEHQVVRERDTPPTKMIDTVVFDLCEDLHPREGVDEKNQCPAGTRACLTKTNRKDDEGDRIVAVVPLATSERDKVEYSALSSGDNGLSLTFKGPSYPSSSGSDSKPQSFNIRLLCDSEHRDLEFMSYDGSELWVEWRTTAACGSRESADPPAGDKPADDTEDGGQSESRMGSGLGYFFLLLFLALVAYFGLGAYYNYSTYGASGMDLIPHRDFWREVPYMLRDLASHLCSAFRPRQSASRSGYIAV
ncbi:hypothetical protein WOLCODRAFT_121884 [Wolfiporia cocos MD-104 SS10]|uniref:Autophagy-related protein 27 n=1 Tax=Wolfiporia cocos (strain MD-104) TaxID=742152 RepID=A0A2H3K4P3_WOLCO|nr:hypothetical protein WOLCODRAFT_121884 [Wolfiporia cocos MD-104 SS10]